MADLTLQQALHQANQTLLNKKAQYRAEAQAAAALAIAPVNDTKGSGAVFPSSPNAAAPCASVSFPTHSPESVFSGLGTSSARLVETLLLVEGGSGSIPTGATPGATTWGLKNALRYTQQVRALNGIIDPPSGSGSPITTLAAAPVVQIIPPSPHQTGPALDSPAPKSPEWPDTVKVYPSLLSALRKAEQVDTGRVWLLLRVIDQRGRGWLNVDQVRDILAGEDHPLRVFKGGDAGWRRLRQVLNKGAGIFWHRDNEGRLWLHSPAKIIAALEAGRLRGQPVYLPVSALLGGIGAVRAHFFASFHSGRKKNNPITRETLRGVTGVPERTQRVYDKVAGVKSHRNLAIGDVATKENQEGGAWQRGRASFTFTDWQGKQGPVGREYVAWEMPKTFNPVHPPAPRGNQRRYNRHIDLTTERAPGHDEKLTRLYFQDGAEAGKAFKQADHPVYFAIKTHSGPYAAAVKVAPQVWGVMSRS